MRTEQEYFNFFLELLAKYININIQDHDIDEESPDWYMSYILSNKSKVSVTDYWFYVGQAFGVTIIRILDDNGFIVDGTSKVADLFTDMVEDFIGQKIP